MNNYAYTFIAISNRICAEHDRQLAERLRELQERRKAVSKALDTGTEPEQTKLNERQAE